MFFLKYIQLIGCLQDGFSISLKCSCRHQGIEKPPGVSPGGSVILLPASALAAAQYMCRKICGRYDPGLRR